MGTEYSIDFTQVQLTQKQFDKFQKIMSKGVTDITNQYASALRDQVIANAQGAPGPQVITGDYIASIQIQTSGSSTFGTGLGYGEAIVVSDAPQANRLEYGYVGIDSLGRQYNQPPFPHWQPALDMVEPQYIQALNDAVPSWWADAAKT